LVTASATSSAFLFSEASATADTLRTSYINPLDGDTHRVYVTESFGYVPEQECS
jgi:hypothetical protein